MSRLALRGFLPLTVLAVLAGVVPARGEVAVEILRPLPGELAFGPVEVELAVEADDPVRSVKLFLDGSLVRIFERPPYETLIDAGQANVEHVFRAVVEDFFGRRAEASVATSRIDVDDEVQVELQQLFVSVSDQGGPVSGLEASEFRILDDRGRPEEIVTFGGGDLPVSSVVLVDSSESMHGEPLEAAIGAVETFASLTREEDETSVVFFSDRLLHAAQLGGEDLEPLLQGLEAAGTTAVNDHLYYALNRLETRLGRRVVILLSDGLDVTSLLDMEEVLWRARRSQATIYWLRLDDRDGKTPRFSSSWRGAEENSRQYETLERTVLDSGGRILSVGGIDRLDAAFRAVMEELRSQYVLGFHPADRRHDGSWRTITVRVPGRRVEIRARAGYVDG